MAEPRAVLGVRPALGKLRQAWNIIEFPRLIFNTAALAIIGTIGTLISCTMVAYGFSRFRFPGRNFLFLVLLSTIFLPGGGHADPDLYDLRRARLGWHLVTAAGAGVLRERL